MNRETRLPTRVSKACNRCRSQKKRCDFIRPCSLCQHAQTECTTDMPSIKTKKSQLQRRSGRRASTTTNVSQATPSYPQEPEQEMVPTNSLSDSAHNKTQESNQVEEIWSTPQTLCASLGQASPGSQNQQERDNPGLPSFGADSALAITRKIFRSQKSPAFKDRATSAIPGGRHRDTNGTNSFNHVSAPLIPISDIIGIELPTYEVCNKLVDTYFSAVHWFSLVVYEPRFRGRYVAVVGSRLASHSDHGFLLLLLMVLIMGCWYTPIQQAGDLNLSEDDTEALRSRMLKVVQRDFMELMDEDCIEFVQLCALLGSFYLYHGRPRSSFSILGAATKTSQAMGLHRDSEMGRSFEDMEERKRVWWTIYTWDRFATITYGRPLGINDKDCDVPMPSIISENVHFDPHLEAAPICLSSYQCQLNRVYRIASPLLEDIYGIRTSHNIALRARLPGMVVTATQALLEWQHNLPPHLSCDHLNDLTAYSLTEEKAHSLQALSLQLTYDNLMIVIHRPLLAVEQSTTLQAMSPDSQYSDDVREIGFKRCLSSALRISNLQRKKNLFDLARKTHLVSFLGMNLFTASVVLFICAWSDTLSDTAQEAKRGLRRTLQMQKALAKHASLSLQCSTILEDLVQLILRKEMKEMLDDHSSIGEPVLGSSALYGEEFDSRRMQQETAHERRESHHSDYLTTFDNAANPEDSHFKQSLMTLQRVILDSSQTRHQVSLADDLSTRQDYGDFIPAENGSLLGGMINSQNIGDSSFTGVEDLGQFWLWDGDNFNF